MGSSFGICCFYLLLPFSLKVNQNPFKTCIYLTQFHISCFILNKHVGLHLWLIYGHCFTEGIVTRFCLNWGLEGYV